MNKQDAYQVLDFVKLHYDSVSQEDWFSFCDMILDIIVGSANKRGWAASLIEDYPELFGSAESV